MTRYQARLAHRLRAFVEEHPGVRLGQVFGDPAAFAGTRMFARVTREGLVCRLPDTGTIPSMRWAPGGYATRRLGWRVIQGSRLADAARMTALLELAARYVATDGPFAVAEPEVAKRTTFVR